MAEPLTIGAIVLAGYLFSQDTDKPQQPKKERSILAPNDIPNSNDRYTEADVQTRSKASKAFIDAGDPYGTNVIPRDFNTVFPQSNDNKKHKNSWYDITPSSFAQSEGVPFGHSNMTPYFGGKLTQNTDSRSGQHRFDASQGGNQSAFYKPKRETKHMFDPVVQRDPRMVEHRDWEHYENSLNGIQNGVKPFQDIRVGPGLGRSNDGVTGQDGFHYGNTRAFRPAVDELRVKGDKQKEEFREAPARGNAFYTDGRAHEWDSVPKNNPDTYWVGFDHERNPQVQGRKASRQREDFTETTGCTQRGVGDELPLGPARATDTYVGIKDDYGIDEHDLRNVRLSGVESRPLGPQGKLSGRGAQKNYKGHASSIGIRNNKAHDTLVYDYAPTPVGNMKRPEPLRHQGKVRGRKDNTRMNRPRRAEAADGTRYRDTTNKSAHDCYRMNGNNASAIRNPNMPSLSGWEVEQHKKNPFTQSLKSVWNE